MKTILEINTTNYASTGNIMLNIAKLARNEGFKAYTASKISKEGKKHSCDNHIFIGFWLDRVISEELAYITGLRGYFNIINTKIFLKQIDKIKPDLIHLHVLHDSFINLNMLFKYINLHNIPVIWTFHDCEAFTGECPYFDLVSCNKWKNGCNHCPQTKIVPKSLLFDTTELIWNKKKKLFTSVSNMRIVTCSKWLADLTKESFFKKYDIKVLNNGINLSVFKPTDSDFRDRYKLQNKYIILGVSNRWSYRKGLDVFISLAKKLDENYQIVLVGTNDKIDKTLPSNIISIHRTYNQEDLAKIYSSADLFVNPTREENFPTVNIESIACGTPVLTYNTGGSPEIIDEKSGFVVEKNDFNNLYKEIIRICENKPYSDQDCISRSKKFDMNNIFKGYVDLYKEVLAK